MFSDGWDMTVVITDILWVLVIAGWVALILGGLEADKPLSGGLPGHVADDEHEKMHWSMGDRVGNIGAWVLFLGTAAMLPVILWWIFVVHPT